MPAVDETRAQPGPTVLSPSRGSELYRNVIQLFSTSDRREWGAGEIKQALTEKSEKVEGKALHNVLNHLERRGALVRVRPGWYRIAGYNVGIAADDIEIDE
jgi:predicted transcriptional regulator of viral defense system